MHFLTLTYVDCRIVYQPSYPVWFPAGGLAIAAIALFMGRFIDKSRQVLTRVVAGAGVLWAVGAGAVVYVSYAEARATSRSSSTPLVEGIVYNVHPAPFAGHENESFDVNGFRFSYSDYVITGGFRQTSSHGGPIREGLHVRIRYIPSEVTDMSGRPTNLIVRLEVCPS